MALFGGNKKTGGSGVSTSIDAKGMRNIWCRHMDAKGVKYSVLDEDDNIVLLSFGGKKFDTIVLADFDENVPCESVHFNSQHFAKCYKSNLPAVIIKLNELNRRFRWVKFWVDEEGHLTADGDCMVYPASVAECVTHCCFRFSNILEDALEALKGYAEPDEETAQALKLAAVLKKLK